MSEHEGKRAMKDLVRFCDKQQHGQAIAPQVYAIASYVSDLESRLEDAEAERDGAQEELSTWRSVFPDIAPASVTPTTETIARQSRDDALEEAAKRIEGVWYIDQDVLPREICEFIRELKADQT